MIYLFRACGFCKAVETGEDAVRSIAWFPVVFSLSLFAFQAYHYFILILPAGAVWLEQNDASIFVYLLRGIAIFLLLNLLYNFRKAVVTDPGAPPFETDVLTEEEEDAETAKYAPSQWPTCRKCRRLLSVTDSFAQDVIGHHE